jgi:hypothetical protein
VILYVDAIVLINPVTVCLQMYNDIPDVLMGDIFVEAALSIPAPDTAVDDSTTVPRLEHVGDVKHEKMTVSSLKSSAQLIEELPDRVKFFALTTTAPSSSSGCILSCDACGIQLKKSSTFIRCAECSSPIIDLCIHCFANGAEFGTHMRHHGYAVVSARSSQILRQSRPISKLSIRSLLRFMEMVESKGSFNFSELEKTLNVIPGDGEKLYLELIAMLSSCDESISSRVSTPSEDPCPPDSGGGPANFNILRDEFEHEYVPEAETLLAAVSLGTNISGLESLFEGYNGILDERERRRKFLKSANLLNLRDYYNVVKKRKTDEREMFEKLRMFIRPVYGNGGQLSFLENLSSVLTTRKRQIDRIKRLATLRRLGVGSEFTEASQFDSDRKKRSEITTKRSKAWTQLPPVATGTVSEKREVMSAEQAIKALPGGTFLTSPGDLEICIDLCISPQHFLVIRSAIESISKTRNEISDEDLACIIQDGVFGTTRRYLTTAQGLPYSTGSSTPPPEVSYMKLRLVQYCRRT